MIGQRQRTIGSRHPLAAMVLALMLVGCATLPLSPDLQAEYDAARDALEAGRHAEAAQAYAVLIPRVQGPVAPLLQLDYGHALLRAGDAAGALAAARAAGEAPAAEVRGRATALAAVAGHEMAKPMMAPGAPYEQARAAGRSAYDSLRRALDRYPQYAPADMITPRLETLREELAALEIAQVRQDEARGARAEAASRAAYTLREFGDTAAVAANGAYLGALR